MGSKHKFRLTKSALFRWTIALSALFVLVSCVAFLCFTPKTSTHYEEILREELSSGDEITVGEVFDFEFDRAYVFLPELCYASGAALCEEYGLDLSIDQVKNGHADSVGRIVFVNESGEYVYLFKYNQWSSLIVAQSEKGQIIYPETVIKLISTENETLFIDFLSDSYYAKTE